LSASTFTPEQLRGAFEIFNQHSSQLEVSYRELKERVALLTDELREVRSARHRELIGKERLSERLELLLESLPGAIVVIDGDGIIRQRNSAAMDLLNEPLDGCAWADVVRREVCEGGSEDGNIQLRDGRWLSLSRRPLKTEAGEILLLADVTESRQMSRLRERQQRLTAIGEMTAAFAHQVRTPLASAMLYASQLEAGTDAQRRIVLKIGERLNDLGRMVNDMLGFAAGSERADETVCVRSLFESVEATVSAQLGAETKLLCLVDGSDPAHADEVEDFVVDGNAEAIKGALINLVMNADQAGGGAASIQLGAWRDTESTWFTVTDDGPGIADEVLPHLFEPFYTTRPQGTGLGLAVVNAVARAHGGTAHAEPLRIGSRFTLMLPRVERGPLGEADE